MAWQDHENKLRAEGRSEADIRRFKAAYERGRAKRDAVRMLGPGARKTGAGRNESPEDVSEFFEPEATPRRDSSDLPMSHFVDKQAKEKEELKKAGHLGAFATSFLGAIPFAEKLTSAQRPNDNAPNAWAAAEYPFAAVTGPEDIKPEAEAEADLRAMRETREKLAEEYPKSAFAGGVAEAILDPLNLVGGALAKGVKGFTAGVRPLLRDAAETAAANAPSSVATSLSEDDTPMQAAKRFILSNLFGYVAGKPGQATGRRVTEAEKFRRDPETGPEYNTAYEGNYRLNKEMELVPGKDTGRSPGTMGTIEEAADLTPKMFEAAKNAEKAFAEGTSPERVAFYKRSEAKDPKVSAMPLVLEFKNQIEQRVFDDGSPVPRTIANDLRKDAHRFVKFRVVPVHEAAKVAKETGGVSVPYESIGPDNITGAGIERPRELGPTSKAPEETGIGAEEFTRTATGVPRDRPGGHNELLAPGGGRYEPPLRKSDLVDENSRPIEVPMRSEGPSPQIGEQPDFIAGPEGVTQTAKGSGLARQREPVYGERTAPRNGSEAKAGPRGTSKDEPLGADYIPTVPKGTERQYAVVMIPRHLSARELEAVRNAYDSAGNAAKATTEETAPLLRISGAAKGMRESFPGLSETIAKEQKELQYLDNFKHAMGLPKGARMTAEDLGQLEASRRRIQQYGDRNNYESNMFIDAFSEKHPEFKEQLNKLRAMNAAEHVRTRLPKGKDDYTGHSLRQEENYKKLKRLMDLFGPDLPIAAPAARQGANMIMDRLKQ